MRLFFIALLPSFLFGAPRLTQENNQRKGMKIKKKCISCEGGIGKLNPYQEQILLTEIPGWTTFIENDIHKIKRSFTFKNFVEAMKFVNHIAQIAEREGHHPDITIFSFNKVKIELYTHAIKGLSKNDFIIAHLINQLTQKP